MRVLGIIIYGLTICFITMVYNSPRTLLHPEYHAQVSSSEYLPKGKKESFSPALKNGKTKFKQYCASCHNKNMKDDLTGPALGGVMARWEDYPKEDLYAWIRNAPALTADKHERAMEISKFSSTEMAIFPNLSDNEIKDILNWIDFVSF